MDELTVPQVFESGARVAWVPALPHLGAWTRVLTDVRDGDLWGVDEDGDESIVCPTGRVTPGLRVIAPAPRDGQRWVGRDFVAFARGVGVGEISVHVSGGGGCFGEAVSVAIWLMEHGYTYVGQDDAAPATLRAPDAAPPDPTQPLPWNRDVARLRISEALTTATPRHRDAHLVALTSLAEASCPPPEAIPLAAAALAVLEAALPERGAIADWQVDRALGAAQEHLEAAGATDTLALWALGTCWTYLRRRMA